MVQELFDQDTRNVFIDEAEQVIQVPDRQLVTVRDPDYHMARLNELETPTDRLREFLASVFAPGFDPTNESRWIKYMALTGFCFGWLSGGFAGTKGFHRDYVRRHNASVFDSDYKAKRHHFDTYIYTICRRGVRYGLRNGLLCASAGLVSFGSISYRAKLYYPDWAVGFAALGSLSRCWLGLRGFVSGGVIGLVGGTVGFGLACSLEKLSGSSVTQIRHLTHLENLRKSQARLDRLQRGREDWSKDILKTKY